MFCLGCSKNLSNENFAKFTSISGELRGGVMLLLVLNYAKPNLMHHPQGETCWEWGEGVADIVKYPYLQMLSLHRWPGDVWLTVNHFISTTYIEYKSATFNWQGFLAYSLEIPPLGGDASQGELKTFAHNYWYGWVTWISTQKSFLFWYLWYHCYSTLSYTILVVLASIPCSKELWLRSFCLIIYHNK